VHDVPMCRKPGGKDGGINTPGLSNRNSAEQGLQSNSGPEVEAACNRLIEALPWELVLVNGNVMWQQQQRPAQGNLAAEVREP